MAETRSNIWPKRISVDKRIVGILSKSTYDSFPNALKELIINGYDADATNIEISLDLSKEQIIIEDNGYGMSEVEFEFFLRIAGRKREKKTKTPSGRYRVGKFGVGFLGVFPFFQNYSIETTKRGEKDVLEASIPCYKYFSNDMILEIGEIEIQGRVAVRPENQSKQYTKITLSGFSSYTKEFFNDKGTEKARRYSYSKMTGEEKLHWLLAEDLPLKYEDPKFNDLTNIYSPKLPFSVTINKTPIFRPLHGNLLLEMNENVLSFKSNQYSNEEIEIEENQVMSIGNIKFQYFILTSKKSIHPYPARFLKIRNLNVGVGTRTAFGLGLEYGGARSRLHWLTGEVHILDGMNDFINVSRDGFGFNPDFQDLEEFLRKRLSYHSNRLEDEADYARAKQEKKIRDIQLLEQDYTFNSEIDEDKIDSNSTDKNHSAGVNISPNDTPTSSSTTTRESEQSSEKTSIKKKLKIGDSYYAAKSAKWDYKEDFYPALQVEDENIIINQNYPLFKGLKYTDIFIKIHLLLVKNHLEGTLDDNDYKKMVNELLETFNEYV